MILCQILCSWSWPGWTALAAIGALSAAGANIFYTVYTHRILKAAVTQTEKNNQIAEFQTYVHLASELNCETAQDILSACIQGNLTIGSQFPSSGVSGHESNYPAQDIRRFILGPIEDIYKFYEDGLISFESLDSGFGYTILNIGNNQAIVEYINYLRKEVYSNNSLYGGFESLYMKVHNNLPNEEKAKYRATFQV